MKMENKPEYTGGSDDLLEQRYLGEYIPVYDASGIWCVQTGHGFESGTVDYIAEEKEILSNGNLCYWRYS